MINTLHLKSPVGVRPLSYRREDDDYNATGLKETIEWVCQDVPGMVFAMGNIFSTFNPQSYEDVQRVCNSYNKSIHCLRWMQKGTSLSLNISSRASRGLLKHIIEQAYNLSVTDPRRLSRYKPFSSKVYGEASYELICQMVDKLDITSEDVFIDLGSGVGQVVLQVSASTNCKLSIGIENAEVPNEYAESMDQQFKIWMNWMGKTYGEYKLINGDFMAEQNREIITSASILFINNFCFGFSEDHYIKEIIKQLKNGTRIITTRAFFRRKFVITNRNFNDVDAILRPLDRIVGPVSWTGKNVQFYLQIVDRSNLVNYLKTKQLVLGENL